MKIKICFTQQRGAVHSIGIWRRKENSQQKPPDSSPSSAAVEPGEAGSDVGALPSLRGAQHVGQLGLTADHPLHPGTTLPSQRGTVPATPPLLSPAHLLLSAGGYLKAVPTHVLKDHSHRL